MAPFATQGKFHQISHELFTLSLWMADYSTETGVLMDKRSPIVRTVPEDSGNACQVLPSVLFQDVLRHKSASYDRGCSYHVLTSLRILKTVPKNVKDIFTFYVKTGA